MAIAFRRATTKADAQVIAAHVAAEGYDLAKWDNWSAAKLETNAKAPHVQVWIAEDAGVLKGFIHWVEAKTDQGPAGWYVGAVVTKALPEKERLALLDTMSLRFGDAFGRKGKWFHEAEADDHEGIAYARMCAPETETPHGSFVLFEGDIAKTYAYILERQKAAKP